MDTILSSNNDKIKIELSLQDFDKYNYGDDPDVSILMLNGQNKITKEKHFLFYGNDSSEDGSISFLNENGTNQHKLFFQKFQKRYKSFYSLRPFIYHMQIYMKI